VFIEVKRLIKAFSVFEAWKNCDIAKNKTLKTYSKNDVFNLKKFVLKSLESISYNFYFLKQ